MRKTLIALVALAAAGCASAPEPKGPFQTKVDGWVEKGDLTVAVADERPLGAPAKKYDTGPLGLPAPFGLTPDHLVDEYVSLDEKYDITGWLLPESMASTVKKMLPKPPSTLPVGVERRPRGAVLRVEASGKSYEVSTDGTGHAHVPLAAIAIATLERGDDSEKVSLDVADGGHGDLVLTRNDLLDIADKATPQLPDHGIGDAPAGGVFWSVVAARAKSRILQTEAAHRAAFKLDEASARLIVEDGGEAELPDGARVDWSAPRRRSDRPPAARIEVSLERGDHDALAFLVRVTNEGEGPFQQLRARTRSNVANASDVLLLLGRLEPGQTIERRLEAVSPVALRGHPVKLTLDFWAADGQAPPPVEASFRAPWR